MPELPEVETVKQGLVAHALDKKITQVVIRQYSLRWPIEQDFAAKLEGQLITGVHRRAKYIVITLEQGEVIMHLGMSGAVCFQAPEEPLRKHDHIIITLCNRQQLRYHDPRRFGSWHCVAGDAYSHPLLKSLGPEPLSDAFNAQYLYALTRNRSRVIKSLIMDQQIVVGVGNIYAAEALFDARIHPLSLSKALNIEHCTKLVAAIKKALNTAISLGGTTLRDFVNTDAKPGYFKQQLAVYSKEGQKCRECSGKIDSCRITQRASAYCATCQHLYQ